MIPQLTVNSAVFQAGGLVVVLVEVNRKPYLASLVPVIVNAILNEHQIIVDIVAFVNKGDFPRSRLGEKQRGKILAGWVTTKMRTLAQFAIRDVDAAALEPGSAGADGADGHRGSIVSVRSGGIPAGSSLRNVEHAPQIPEHEEYAPQVNQGTYMPPPNMNHHPMELPDDESTIVAYSQRTIQEPQPMSQPPQQLNLTHQTGQGFGLPDFERFSTMSTEQGPQSAGPKSELRSLRGQAPPQIRLPGVDGREEIDFWRAPDNDADDEDWTSNAIMHMNLAGNTDPRP